MIRQNHLHIRHILMIVFWSYHYSSWANSTQRKIPIFVYKEGILLKLKVMFMGLYICVCILYMTFYSWYTEWNICTRFLFFNLASLTKIYLQTNFSVLIIRVCVCVHYLHMYAYLHISAYICPLYWFKNCKFVLK